MDYAWIIFHYSFGCIFTPHQIFWSLKYIFSVPWQSSDIRRHHSMLLPLPCFTGEIAVYILAKKFTLCFHLIRAPSCFLYPLHMAFHGFLSKMYSCHLSKNKEFVIAVWSSGSPSWALDLFSSFWVTMGLGDASQLKGKYRSLQPGPYL